MPGVSITKGAFNQLEKPQIWPTKLKASPAAKIQQEIWETVGARPWDRDEIDSRIIRQSRAATTRIINSEEEVGGRLFRAKTKSHSRKFNAEEWDECFERKEK